MSGNPSIAWRPQAGPQQALIDCNLPEVFFGGARGGGKTDAVLGKWGIKAGHYGPDFNAIMFRRTTVSAEDAIERAKQIYLPVGARFVGSPNPTFHMPGGGRISFRYLESVSDADEWQGRNVTDAWVEEAGQYPLPAPIDRLNGVLRSAQGVPTQLVLTANPGGAGQSWIRAKYELHPFPSFPRVITKTLANGAIHKIAVIPSRIADNRILTNRDPNYINRLYMVGSAELVRGWLMGDWSAIPGAFFDVWNENEHVIAPFQVPDHWMRFRSADWGYANPFSVGWWAVVSDPFETPDEGKILPRGAIVRYREWYGGGQGAGLRLDAEEWGKGILSRELLGKDKSGTPVYEKISYGVLDPSAFAQSGGPSIAERLFTATGGKVMFRPADNSRVGSKGALGGWDQMRARLKGQDGVPMLYSFSTCSDFIRTIPVLQHDQDKPEDLDTDGEDHAADEARYACMSRPWTAPAPKEREIQIKVRQPTMADLMAHHDRQRRNAGNRI